MLNGTLHKGKCTEENRAERPENRRLKVTGDHVIGLILGWILICKEKKAMKVMPGKLGNFI